MIACEDTRVTKKLCVHYDIHKLKSYHDHNKEQQTDYLIEQLAEVLIACIRCWFASDPGYELVVAARKWYKSRVYWTKCRLTANGSGLPSFTLRF